MRIQHKIDDFLFAIFPEIKINDRNALVAKFEEYYTYGTYKPKVTVENDWVIVEVDSPAILSHQNDYHKVVALCEKGKYLEAKPILQKLIENNPTNSEYHRIMGQIFSDEGNQEEAINCLIDALRWNSTNGWALLMMGNIFAKYKNDIPTAMKYYDQALIANPNDYITMTNIGFNLLQQKKVEEAKKYFLQALKINSEYPNAHYALGMIAEFENDLNLAFNSTLQAIKLNKNKDVLYQNSVKQILKLANNLILSDEGEKIYKNYRSKLEFESGTEIDIVENNEITTAAKIEIAEYHNRPKHIVKYKPKYPAVEHLIMHELVHLDFVIEARKNDLNQVFISNNSFKSLYLKDIEPTIKKFKNLGIPENSIANYCSSLFDGINLQIYNAPIDLFIETRLNKEYPELRPYQFLSLYALIQEGIKSVTDKKVIEISPKDILSKSKIYNLVNAIHFKELFGLDFIKEFNPAQSELKQAQEFYNEYLQYKDDKEPGEEYEMIIHWAEDLKLDKYFELEGEVQFRKRSNIDTFFKALEKDPLGLDDKDPIKEREMKKFQKSQKEIGTNMAVVMFMVDAMQYFEDMPMEKIKKIALEIALQGTQGYRPDKTDYKIKSIPEKVFSGYHILAYYYVSYALAIPDMLSKLELPFDNEYKVALTLKKP